jgi:hypothetical protein
MPDNPARAGNLARERELRIGARDKQLLMRGADSEHRARELADHIGNRPRGLARAAYRVMERQIQDDLVGVVVAGSRRPRPAAIVHPLKRFPRQHEHAQPRRDQRLALPERRP